MKISDLSLSPLSSPSIKLPIHLPHSLPPQPHPTRLLLSLFWENGKHPSSTPPSPLSLSSLSLEISSWSRATMANRTSDLLRRVDSALQLDENALLRYASANVDGFPLSPSTFTVSQVSFSLHFLSLSRFFVQLWRLNFFCWSVKFSVRAWAIEPDVSSGSELWF